MMTLLQVIRHNEELEQGRVTALLCANDSRCVNASVAYHAQRTASKQRTRCTDHVQMLYIASVCCAGRHNPSMQRHDAERRGSVRRLKVRNRLCNIPDTLLLNTVWRELVGRSRHSDPRSLPCAPDADPPEAATPSALRDRAGGREPLCHPPVGEVH